MKDFIGISKMTKDEIIEVLDMARELEKNPKPDILKGKIIASLFFEPSTRTRLSFTAAAYKLGANVLGFENPDVTSLKKGESLNDTIKIVEGYSDLIVIRHPEIGTAEIAANISEKPVINAGDGANEHPSQTLLDLFTIRKEFKTLDNIKIAFVGDLKYGRTVHSLLKAMKLFNARFYFVAPKSIQIPDKLLKELDDMDISYSLHENYEEIIDKIDVMYVTRIQRERFDDIEEYKKVSGIYKIKDTDIIGKTKENMIIMHPLPRVDEIDVSVDNLPNAKYFDQAKNGVVVREAMYILALKGEK